MLISFPFFHVLNNRNCVHIFDFVTIFNGCFQEFHLRENIFFLVKIDLVPGDSSKRHEALGGQGDRKEQLFLLLVGEEGLDANDFVSLS